MVTTSRDMWPADDPLIIEAGEWRPGGVIGPNDPIFFEPDEYRAVQGCSVEGACILGLQTGLAW